MNKLEKKQVRLQINDLLDDHCRNCERFVGKKALSKSLSYSQACAGCNISQQLQELSSQIVVNENRGRPDVQEQEFRFEDEDYIRIELERIQGRKLREILQEFCEDTGFDIDDVVRKYKKMKSGHSSVGKETVYMLYQDAKNTLAILEKNHNNMSRTAKELGVTTTSLYTKIRKATDVIQAYEYYSRIFVKVGV